MRDEASSLSTENLSYPENCKPSSRRVQNMDDDDFATWNRSMRERAITYLEGRGINSPQIGAWPAFEIAPKFGIWCVESQKQPGKIGWWVFAGDCPTDYVAEDGQCHPRAALTNLVKRWADWVPHMKSGKQPPDVSFGGSSDIRELGELLERRVSILQDWLADDDLWEDR